MMRVPLKWAGGKGTYLQFILPNLPKNRVYVEPFGGSATVLCSKPPSEFEVYNDLDDRLSKFFNRIKTDCSKLSTEYMYTLYSRAEFERAVETQDVLIGSRMGFSGCFKNVGQWSKATTMYRNNMAKQVSSFRLSQADFKAVSQRFSNVEIRNECALKIIREFDSSDTVFYLDPPYVHDSRKKLDLYKFEQSNEFHKAFIDLALTCKGALIISGYHNPIYKKLNGWCIREYKTFSFGGVMTETNKESMQRTEVLWLNHRAVEQL